MQDALLNKSLRLTVVGTIASLSLAGLVMCYQALFELIGLDLPSAAMKIGWGILCAAAAGMLIHYRSDLIDD